MAEEVHGRLSGKSALRRSGFTISFKRSFRRSSKTTTHPSTSVSNLRFDIDIRWPQKGNPGPHQQTMKEQEHTGWWSSR
ncbi:hypothetical protein DPMN_077834 [Dreissena polymorpha]|uniref:Uncharacterized protein n=1 Tax=Dreissena polymorpha TaxID=45954 RepID=A0A9D3YRD4_DREPO|nr:hypothetical protein DPMN_077834 [Dreissena polymorpha]